MPPNFLVHFVASNKKSSRSTRGPVSSAEDTATIHAQKEGNGLQAHSATTPSHPAAVAANLIPEFGSLDPLVSASNASTFHCVFHLSRLLHWGPFIALFIILYIFAISLHCISIIWPIQSSWGAIFHIAIYIFQLYLVLYNYLKACAIGPGFVPFGWRPMNKLDCQYLQYCSVCDGFKPPRAHHCRKCNRCCLKMDHHCPWINICCGHFNHGYFVRFLFFAPVGCVHSMWILGSTVWTVVKHIFYDASNIYNNQPSHPIMGLVEFLMVFFAFGLAFGVVIAVGMLFVVQIRSILANETGIENYIANKAKYRREELNEDAQSVYSNPYSLGRKQNLAQVFTWRGLPVGNGADWPTQTGVNRFYMTIEQLKQKRDKLINSQTFVVKQAYTGHWFPWRQFGCAVACRFPISTVLSDENRLTLQLEEIVRVTRWRKHWYYGQIIRSPHKCLLKTGRFRGWFPKRCVTIVSGDNNYDESVEQPHEHAASSNGSRMKEE